MINQKKRDSNGKRIRHNPEKPCNRRRGTDSDECRIDCPWCQDCNGSLEDTFKCQSRINHWLASLPNDNSRKEAIEKYKNKFFPLFYGN